MLYIHYGKCSHDYYIDAGELITYDVDQGDSFVFHKKSMMHFLAVAPLI